VFVPVNGDVVNRDLLLGRVGLLLELEVLQKRQAPPWLGLPLGV
jgi:hypothetical protein